MECGPDIGVDAKRLVGAPDKAAAEERGKKEDAVVPLGSRARHLELVEEPVEIEERGGELVENECGAVKVYERTLPQY